MKNLALLVGVALLASCGAKKDAAAPEASASADASMPMDAGASPAAAMTTIPGSYDVTNPDGSKFVGTLMAGGTYVDRDAKDKVVEKGTWADKDGKLCLTPAGKTETCYTSSAPAADGSSTLTGPDGKVTQMKPHAKM